MHKDIRPAPQEGAGLAIEGIGGAITTEGTGLI